MNVVYKALVPIEIFATSAFKEKKKKNSFANENFLVLDRTIADYIHYKVL